MAFMAFPLLRLTNSASAQCRFTTAPLIAPTGLVSGDNFGRSLDVDGETAVVASHNRDDVGKVYVYRRIAGTWQEVAVLSASDAATLDAFGSSVAIQGDTIVIGAVGDDDNGGASGSAYVFQEMGGVWSQVAKLTANDGAANESFGNSVDIDGDTIVVGAYAEDGAAMNRGAAYVFERNAGLWLQAQKLLASDASTSNLFGASVALEGDVMVIGARGDGDVVANSGSAYVFRKSMGAWQEEVELKASDPQIAAWFGVSVAVRADTVVVGASQFGSAGNGDNLQEGAAYVFRDNGGAWPQIGRLMAPAPSDFAGLGRSVHIIADGDVFVGASGARVNGLFSGCVYVFREFDDDWRYITQLSVNGPSYMYVGASVAVSGTTAWVGAPGSDFNGVGSAYVFELDWSPNDCNANGIPDPCEIEGYLVSDCDANGVPDECDIANGTHTDCNGNGVPDVCDLSDADFTIRRLSSELATKGAKLGQDVAIDQDLAIVNAAQTNGIFPPFAYIFRQEAGGWHEVDRVSPDGLGPDSGFGFSVDVDTGVFVVGAPSDENPGVPNSGSAYVYQETQDGWESIARLSAPDAATGDGFGLTVSMSGERIAVGTWADDVAGVEDQGSAYVFRRMNGVWVFESQVVASDGVTDDVFGRALGLDGQTLVVGALEKDDPARNSGAAYVFRASGTGWSQIARLFAPDVGEDDWFGSSVAISGDTIVVGAPGDDDNGLDSGAAYVFREIDGAWTQTDKLSAGVNASGNDGFGGAVDIDGDMILVGAERDRLDGRIGAAFVFRRVDGVWERTSRLDSRDVTSYSGFAISLAISDGVAIVGAVNADVTDEDSGVAYLYSVRARSSDCNADQIADECQPGDFDGSGCVDLPDVGGFVDALLTPDADCVDLGDLNGDDHVNALDVHDFVSALLAGDGCP